MTAGVNFGITTALSRDFEKTVLGSLVPPAKTVWNTDILSLSVRVRLGPYIKFSVAY